MSDTDSKSGVICHYLQPTLVCNVAGPFRRTGDTAVAAWLANVLYNGLNTVVCFYGVDGPPTVQDRELEQSGLEW